MDKRNTRRINPVAHFATLAVTALVVFEVLVMAGALELKAQTVAKYAPWAYEPFLKLVGEHPDSAPRLAVVQEDEDADISTLALTGLGDFPPEAIPVLAETNETERAENIVPGPSASLEAEAQPSPTTSTNNLPVFNENEIVPVG